MPFDPPAQLARARVLTRALRTSPWWSSVRDEARSRGLDPADLILLDSFDDDEGLEVGLLATSEERLIAWRREYDDDAGTSRILEWREVTDAWGGALWESAAAEYTQARRNARIV